MRTGENEVVYRTDNYHLKAQRKWICEHAESSVPLEELNVPHNTLHLYAADWFWEMATVTCGFRGCLKWNKWEFRMFLKRSCSSKVLRDYQTRLKPHLRNASLVCLWKTGLRFWCYGYLFVTFIFCSGGMRPVEKAVSQ